MTGVALVFLVLSIVIVWGGMIASMVFLGRRPGLDVYPDGGEDEGLAAAGDLPRDL